MSKTKKTEPSTSQSTLPATLEEAHEEILALRESLGRSGRKCAKTLARFAHDMAGALVGPMGYLQFAERTVTDLPTAKSLRLARSTLSEAHGMVHDIQLRVAHDQNRLTAMRHVVDLHEAVDLVIDSYMPLAEDKKLNLWKHIKPECPRHLLGDTPLLKRILSNLVSNAVKYTQDGSVGVVVSYANRKLSIRVIDTGMGIKEDDQTRIFRTFQRASTDTFPEAEGFGIGLSVVAELVALLEGEISLQSTEGRGTQFFLSLPFPPAPAS